MSRANASSLFSDRAASSTVAPAAASLGAVASPIPKDAPVTRTVAPDTASRRRSGAAPCDGLTTLSRAFAARLTGKDFPRTVLLNPLRRYAASGETVSPARRNLAFKQFLERDIEV